jgi:hypothetical protein
MNGKFKLFFCLLVFCAFAGCQMDSFNPNKGKVDKVQKDWTLAKVIKTIGDPEYVILGKGIKTGSEELVYPTGSVFLYRLIVVEVLERDEDDPKPEQPKEQWVHPIAGQVE